MSAPAQSHQHAAHSFNHITESPAPHNTNWEISTFTICLSDVSARNYKNVSFPDIYISSDDQILIVMFSKEDGQRVSLRSSPPPYSLPYIGPIHQFVDFCILSANQSVHMNHLIFFGLDYTVCSSKCPNVPFTIVCTWEYFLLIQVSTCSIHQSVDFSEYIYCQLTVQFVDSILSILL